VRSKGRRLWVQEEGWVYRENFTTGPSHGLTCMAIALRQTRLQGLHLPCDPMRMSMSSGNAVERALRPEPKPAAFWRQVRWVPVGVTEVRRAVMTVQYDTPSFRVMIRWCGSWTARGAFLMLPLSSTAIVPPLGVLTLPAALKRASFRPR